jgi:hypothetical protein
MIIVQYGVFAPAIAIALISYALALFRTREDGERWKIAAVLTVMWGAAVIFFGIGYVADEEYQFGLVLNVLASPAILGICIVVTFFVDLAHTTLRPK